MPSAEIPLAALKSLQQVLVRRFGHQMGTLIAAVAVGSGATAVLKLLMHLLSLTRSRGDASGRKGKVQFSEEGSRKTSRRSSGEKPLTSPTSGRPKVQVDKLFIRRLLRVLKLCYPSFWSRDTATLGALVTMLLLRTRLTVVMANVVADNAKHLVQRNLWEFIAGVLEIGILAFPSSVVNTAIKYCTSLLENGFRKNAQKAIHAKYLASNTMYKLTTDFRDANDNVDHRMTEDLLAFCTNVTELLPSVFKPTVDIVTFMYQLSFHGGFLPPSLMVLYYVLSGALLRSVLPNFAKLTATSAHREGDFRSSHMQVIQHAEEVAFYRGEKTERQIADTFLDSLIRHQLRVQKLKALSDFAEGILVKYGATCAGYAVCSIGVFEQRGKLPAHELTRIYIQSSQLYMPLARAIGKIVMLHKQVTALAGYTSRVGELCETFDRVEERQAKEAVKSRVHVVPRSDTIDIKDVSIISPTGQLLLKNFTATFTRGTHVLVMGGNGSGKTSLMRALAGMWPISHGSITRPELGDVFCMPQRGYFPHGSMRSQLVYPDTEHQAFKKGVTDDELLELVENVGLTAVVERCGGLNAIVDWHDVLSGGEKQRTCLVRLLYARPKFGLLDECTSAVNQDMEPQLYIAAKRRGITLVTVSHRESLKTLHDVLIHLDGEGGYTSEAIVKS